MSHACPRAGGINLAGTPMEALLLNDRLVKQVHAVQANFKQIIKLFFNLLALKLGHLDISNQLLGPKLP